MVKLFLVVLSIFNFQASICNSQEAKVESSIKKVGKLVKVKRDTAFIDDLTTQMTLRIFGSKDYIDYKLFDDHFNEQIDYKPNIPFTLGIGASYKFAAFNIGFAAPFVNKNHVYGTTHFFDVSTHFYLQRYSIDIYGNSYHGYYLNNAAGLVSPPNLNNPNYLRPDLLTGFIGISFQYIFNAARFSYLGAFSQTEYQKKSAGSFLFGAGIYTEFTKADSQLIPANFVEQKYFGGSQFNKSNIYSVVLNGGYAYTLVFKKHFFVTGSLDFGIGLNYITLTNTITESRTGNFEPLLNTDYRIATGYNSDNYFFSVQYVHLLNKSYTSITGTREDFGTGNYRLIIAKRFKLKHHNVIDKTINKAINTLSN
ncbi:MAG TPA: DUF4421 family protein [Flavipsychrobacter sp.]|nr:DUF4421 family protein [Flavipsychrobacter sp.]